MIGILTALTIAAPPTTAAELALGCVCHTHPRKAECKAERRADVARSVEDLLEITRARGEAVPPAMRLILVAVACGESGIRDRPTCGGRLGCNDYGTSGGMFQIKLTRRKHSLRWLYDQSHTTPLDVYDHKLAGAFYLDRLITGAMRGGKVYRACGWRGRTVREVWSIAAVRLGRGPILYWKDTAPGAPRKAVQRCTPTSRYVAVALRWWKRCPECWQL